MAQQSEPVGGADGSPGTPGRTSIVDSIVTTIAGLAARTVRGVDDLGDHLAPAPSPRPDHAGSLHRATGVSACVDGRAATVRLALVVAYGADLTRLERELRACVTEVIGSMTGLHVLAVDVDVVGVRPPGEREPAGGAPDR